MWQRCSTLPLSLILPFAAVPAAAQVEVTVHGGPHMDLAIGARHELQRLDAQQYLFSSPFDAPYTPHLGTAPAPAHASGLRHDFVVLAGFAWRSD